ncbi:MAG: ABC transporter ATP-binding protein/permease [Clostridia bacterium]|nr:ABC transporter ATP-binding protein/permease [Clostridia bacterium]
MIHITNLTKIYRSRRRSICRALDKVNLTLPDAGLVFVLGKSGSGKSTLLNLIGGLDSITEGRILVDGNDLSTFREQDFCNYRNTHIGFIFQDYHLIDELTVSENILLSLNLRRMEDGDRVRAALEKVDLAGYGDRYPSELSGGERQRIAIARAIVKNPRIILADEPTGNLDTNTATAITELLRSLSRECLILVVSHNLNDANKYADRIVELSHGRIVGDRTRNPEFLDEVTLKDGALVYPAGLALSEEDVRLMNANKSADILRKTDKYFPTPEQKGEGKQVAIENKSLTLGKSLHLSGRFLKNKAIAISLSSFMVAVIMVIMALAQTIINFDAGEVMSAELHKSAQSSLLLSKTIDPELQALTQINALGRVEAGDMEAFYEAGYEGKIYQGLSYSIPIAESSVIRGKKPVLFSGNNPYVRQTIATLVVDDAFLESRFDGVEYVARRSTFHPQGVIITDYVADAILLRTNYIGKDYDYLIQWGYTLSGWNYDAFIINGIIKTGYKERYEGLFEKLKKNPSMPMTELYEDPDFQTFSKDVYARLGYSYTTNQSFLEDYLAAENWRYPSFYHLAFEGAQGYEGVSYVIRDNRDNGTMALPYHENVRYTETTPEIPEGAKYMRVSYHKSWIQKLTAELYGEEQVYPILAFDHGTPLSQEVFEQNKGYLLTATGGLQLSSASSSYYVSELIEIPEGAKITSFLALAVYDRAYCTFYDEEKNYISAEVAHQTIDEGSERTVYLPAQVYAQIFPERVEAAGADWGTSFVPHQEKLAHFAFWDVKKENPLFEAEVTVKLSPNTVITLSDDLFTLFYKDSIFPIGLYFDGAEGLGRAVELAGGMDYEYQSIAIEAVHTMTRAVEVFVPIFELVAIFLCVGVVFILVNFATRMIKDKLHEIGILKAIGTHNTTIGVVFGLQVMLIALLTCIMATAGYYLFIGMANDVLVESLSRLAPSRVMMDLEFLTFKPKVALVNCGLILLLSILSLALPMIKIKRIKPVQIIKAKE